MSQPLKVGLGTVQYGSHYGISNKVGQTTLAQVTEILSYANRSGISILDTAAAYGNAETVLGNNDLSCFKIVSKFLPAIEPLEVQFKKTISDLKVKCLYGYLAHRPTDIMLTPEIWDELLDLKARGLVKKIGFSFNAPSELEDVLNMNMNPDLIQVPYSYLDRRFDPYFELLKNLGCEIHTRSAFLQGLFFTQPDFLPEFFRSVKAIINNLQQTYKESLSSLLLKFVHDHRLVDCVIIGSENVNQLRQNLQFAGQKMSLPTLDETIPNEVLMPMYWPKKS